MRLLLWTTAGLCVWILGGVCSAAGSVRRATWLLLSNLGLGLCCFLLAMISLDQPPLGHPFWIRLLWSTLVLTMPAWVAFSLRFGRPHDARPGDTQKVLLFLLWIAAPTLLVLGIVWPPLEIMRDDAGKRVTVLLPPIGRWLTIHMLVGMALLLWNLHSTLEAARAAARRRISGAIYALLPLLMIGLYIIAEFLLFGQKRETSTDLLLGATFLSTICFVGVVGRRKLEEMDLPVGTQITLSPAVLTALGAFFLGLALVSMILRFLGIESRGNPYEEVTIGILVAIFSLSILPGIREEFLRFINRRLCVPPIGERDTWERIQLALASIDSVQDLAFALRFLLRERFGLIRMHIWIYEPVAGDFLPAERDGLARLSPRHPLIQALRSRAEPLLMTGSAMRIDELPLHATTEEIAEQHGLRVFLPMRVRGHLVAVLGCGPSGDRTLHPEDIELLQKIADRLALRVAALSGNQLDGITAEGTESRAPEDLSEIPLRPWLDTILRRAQTARPSRAEVQLHVNGPEHVLLDRALVEPMVYYLLANALDLIHSENVKMPITVTITQGGRIAFDLFGGKTTLSLRLLAEHHATGEQKHR